MGCPVHALLLLALGILRSTVCAFVAEIGEGVLLLLVLSGNAHDAGDGVEIDTTAPWRRSRRRRHLRRAPRHPRAFVDDGGRIFVEVAELPGRGASLVVEVDMYTGYMASLWPDRPSAPLVTLPRGDRLGDSG